MTDEKFKGYKKTMKPLNLVTVFLITLTGCSNQTPVVAQAEKSDDGIISKIEEILGGKGIASEAFIVLKNDEVRYMADMEIIFFDDSVKDAFQKLRQERSEAKSNMSIEAINNNPAMAKAMQELNASRTEIAERERSIDGKVEEMRLNLIANLKDSLNDLSQQLESGGKVLEEFKEITTPFDEKIRANVKEGEDLKKVEKIDALEKRAFVMVNDYIVKNSIKVAKMNSAKGSLNHTEQSGFQQEHPQNYSISSFNDKTRFLHFDVQVNRNAPSYYDRWKYFTNIPKECSPLLSELTALWRQKGSIENQAKILQSERSNLKNNRRAALIPWENRHDVDQDQFEEQYGRITREHENTKQRLDALQNEGPERDQILEEMVSQIKEEIAEQREQLDEVEAKIQEKAIESMSDNLRYTYYNKFTSMLGAESELSIRTGSKGDFIIPAGMDYLFATRSRSSGENIFWFLKIDPKFGNFRLSNSNAKFVGEYGDTMTWMYEDFYLE